MHFDVFSVFPEVMQTYLEASVLGKAQVAGHVSIALHQIRDYASDRHRTTDDEPFGGGGGMVMKPEPVFTAVESVLGPDLDSVPVILLTPQGRVFDQKIAAEYAVVPRVALLCGRYEGVDERIRQHLATDEVSIGDYVLTGGELPALIVIDAVTRLIPGVLGDENATTHDSHAYGLLEHPHYTRPASFRGWEVPQVLVSGDHARVQAWRRAQSLLRTKQRRPDLLGKVELSREDRKLLDEASADEEGESRDG